jgi:hypothetical protein
MSGAIIREALTKVTFWGGQRLWRKVSRAAR